MQQDLLQAYSGDLATTYEAGRASSPRWANEVAAMERLLAAWAVGRAEAAATPWSAWAGP